MGTSADPIAGRREKRFDRVELLLRAPDAEGGPLVLLRCRASASGPVWELPGAALRGAETPARAAVRMAERSVPHPGPVRLRAEWDATDSTPALVIADVAGPLPGPAQRAAELTWFAEPDVGALNLTAALAARWPALRAAETGLVVDAANVVGSRPDGWWRDRAGAAERLLREIAAAGPGLLVLPGGRLCWVARPVVVLEGAARDAPDVPGVAVVRAPKSGDDTIVDLAWRGGDWIVVTADRGLRGRLPASALPIGPSALRSWLAAPS